MTFLRAQYTAGSIVDLRRLVQGTAENSTIWRGLALSFHGLQVVPLSMTDQGRSNGMKLSIDAMTAV
jgi:hypothetical protein